MAAVSSTDSVVCVTNASFSGSRTSSFARLLDVLDEVHAPAVRGVEAPHGAFDFRMPGMADEHDVATFARVPRDFHVHLGHQRTGGVEHREAAPRGFVLHGRGHAMRGEDDRGAVGHLVELVDEHRAELAQALDHVHVVHDLVAHVDRRAEQCRWRARRCRWRDRHRRRSLWDWRAGSSCRRGRARAAPSSSESRITSAAPMVMAASATLNAGK